MGWIKETEIAGGTTNTGIFGQETVGCPASDCSTKAVFYHNLNPPDSPYYTNAPNLNYGQFDSGAFVNNNHEIYYIAQGNASRLSKWTFIAASFDSSSYDATLCFGEARDSGTWM